MSTQTTSVTVSSRVYTIDGRKFGRVSAVADDRPLSPYARRYAHCGTGTHGMVSSTILGCLDGHCWEPLSTNSVEEWRRDWRRTLTAYEGWRLFDAEHLPHYGLVEQLVVHPRLSYAGTLDAVICIAGEWWLVDWKTGGSISKAMLRLYKGKCAAYLMALETSAHLFPGFVLELAGVMLVRLDTKMPAYEIEATWRHADLINAREWFRLRALAHNIEV